MFSLLFPFGRFGQQDVEPPTRERAICPSCGGNEFIPHVHYEYLGDGGVKFIPAPSCSCVACGAKLSFVRE